MEYVFGPVPSRRLGMSLGVDLIPHKTCSYDCIYCELGKTTHKTTIRKEYVSKDLVLKQLEDYLPLLDFEIKRITTIPVAVITNGSLFFIDQVKEDLLQANIVLPSLDAVSPLVFKHINRPEPSLDIKEIIKGLIDFRKEFSGQIWLEILFCRVLNDDHAEVERMREKIEYIKPDRVQLNTVVRPSSEDFAYPLKERQLVSIKEILGARVELISDIVPSERGTSFANKEEKIINLISRRPCTCDDLCKALGLHHNEALKYLDKLLKEGWINYKLHHHRGYYHVMNL